MSADPLTVHELGADPNPYAYVHGSILRATDPLGLEDDKPTAAPAPGASQGQGSPVPSRAAPSGLQGARAVAGFFLNRAWEWIRGPLTPEGGVSQIAEAVGTRIEHGVDQAIADPKGFVGGMADKADTVVQVATAAAMVAEAVSGGPPIPPMTAPSLASAGAAGSVAASPQAALVPPVLLAGKQAAGGNEGGSGQNATEGGGASGTGVQQVNGRSPINSRYAGGTHPSGVKFNEQGFPDFSPWTKATVKLEGLTGDYAKDAAMANKAVRLETTPEGYVWHHVEDGRTMQLVQQDIHQAVRHTGGAALIRGGGP